MRQRRFVRGGSVSIWTFSQKTFLLVVSRCTLLIVRQSGKRLSRRRAMRRRKRASLDVRRIPSTQERRHSMSQCLARRVCALLPRRRVSAIAGRKPHRRFPPQRPAKTRGCLLRDGAALTRRRGKSAHNPLATVFGPTIPTFPRARNAQNVERRALAPPHRASA